MQRNNPNQTTNVENTSYTYWEKNHPVNKTTAYQYIAEKASKQESWEYPREQRNIRKFQKNKNFRLRSYSQP